LDFREDFQKKFSSDYVLGFFGFKVLSTFSLSLGVLQANQVNGAEKLSLLNQVSNKIDLLRILIRLAHDIKNIDQKKYLNLQSHLDEIGRMLGGWMKNIRTKHSNV